MKSVEKLWVYDYIHTRRLFAFMGKKKIRQLRNHGTSSYSSYVEGNASVPLVFQILTTLLNLPEHKLPWWLLKPFQLKLFGVVSNCLSNRSLTSETNFKWNGLQGILEWVADKLLRQQLEKNIRFLAKHHRSARENMKATDFLYSGARLGTDLYLPLFY